MLFDIFRHVATHGKALTTPVKVMGATLSLVGQPKEYTVKTLSDLAANQVNDIKVSLPRVIVVGTKESPIVSAQTKGLLAPAAAAAAIQRDANYGTDTVKETKAERKARLKAEAEAEAAKQAELSAAAS